MCECSCCLQHISSDYTMYNVTENGEDLIVCEECFNIFTSAQDEADAPYDMTALLEALNEVALTCVSNSSSSK